MPLTAKGEKIMAAMKEKYGAEKGEKVFHASRNAGKISGVDDIKSDDDPKWNVYLNTHPHKDWVQDDVKKLVAHCDALSQRMDAFEKRKNQKQPSDIKPKIKDNMQPSNPHPKEPGGG
jgi:hypothetical protein